MVTFVLFVFLATSGFAQETDNSSALWGDSADDEKIEVQKNPQNQNQENQTPGKVENLEQEVETLKEQIKSLLDAEEVRGELKESTEEKEAKEEDILNAAGREYTLMKKGTLGLEYKIGYTYYSYDAIRELNIIEHNSNHTITNTFTIEYPLKNNLTINSSIPFVYEYDQVGADNSKSATDFGDVSFGASYQPIKTGGDMPSIIIGTSLTCPMGRNPYEINSDTELSTGSGGYSLGTSLSVSKAVDPIMAYGTLSYSYKFPIEDLDYKIGSYTLEKYDRGDSIGVSLGIGYALSYMTSISFGYSYSYGFESKRYYKEAEAQTYPTTTSSSISVGTSWRLSQKMRVNLSLGMGLGNSDYFSLSLRFPFSYKL